MIVACLVPPIGSPPRRSLAPSFPLSVLAVVSAAVVAGAGVAGWTFRGELVVAYDVHAVAGASDAEAFAAALKTLRRRDLALSRAAILTRLDANDAQARQNMACALTLLTEDAELTPESIGAENWVFVRLATAGDHDPTTAPALSWPTAGGSEPFLLEDPRLGADARAIVDMLLREAREAVDPVIRWRAVRALHSAPKAPWLREEFVGLLEGEKDENVRQLLFRVLLGLESPPGADTTPDTPELARRLDACVSAALADTGALSSFVACVRGRGYEALDATARGRLTGVMLLMQTYPFLSQASTLSLPRQAAVEDALACLALAPCDQITISTLINVLQPATLEDFDDHPELLPALRDLFVHLRDPRWAEGLEGVLATPRHQHWPDVQAFDFSGARWCDEGKPCVGELPWLGLLALDADRAFDALSALPPNAQAWIGHAEAPCRCSTLRAPRRLPTLKFLNDSGRRRAVADACGPWLRSWPVSADLGPTPAVNARQFLLARHELRHRAELRAQISLDVLVAEGGDEAVKTLEQFGRAWIPVEGALKTLSAGARLGSAVARRALPDELVARTPAARAALAAQLERLSGAHLALGCLALLDTPHAAAAASGIRRLLAHPTADEADDEAVIVWALIRARKTGVLGDEAGAALEVRLPELLEAEDWPWHGGPEGQRIAMAILTKLSPTAAERGKRILAAGLDPDYEAFPLSLYWGTLDAVAAELNVDVRPSPIEISGLDTETFPGDPQAVLFATRSFTSTELTPLDRRLRCWFLTQHLDRQQPSTPLELACWLLTLEAVEEALRLEGPALPAPEPLPAPTPRRLRLRGPDEALLRAVGGAAETWAPLQDELSRGLGMYGCELSTADVPATADAPSTADAPAELIVTPVAPPQRGLRLRVVRGKTTTRDVLLRTPAARPERAAAIRRLIKELPALFP